MIAIHHGSTAYAVTSVRAFAKLDDAAEAVRVLERDARDARRAGGG